MMKNILEFIKELDPKHEVSKLNYFHMTDNDYRKVCLTIKKWVNDGVEVPQEYINHVNFLIR